MPSTIIAPRPPWPILDLDAAPLTAGVAERHEQPRAGQLRLALAGHSTKAIRPGPR